LQKCLCFFGDLLARVAKIERCLRKRGAVVVPDVDCGEGGDDEGGQQETPVAPIESDSMSYFFRRLHAVAAPVGSMAAEPSSMCCILPSLSMTNVDRLATPLGARTP